jgi:hypothetical protein
MYPSSHSAAIDGSFLQVNPSFLCRKQHDKFILNAFLYSLYMDVLRLVVDCQTLHYVWCILEQTLASPSNFRIMQLHSSFQDLRQGDDSITIYLQKVKALIDELSATG